MINILTVYITEGITLSELVLSLVVSLLIGVVLAGVYIFTKRKEGYSRNFIMALIIMPVIISMIIQLVSSDIIKVLSLGGIFTIMRFRTRINNVKDAAYLFSVIGLAFACGFGYYAYVLIVGLFVILILLLLSIFKIDHKTDNEFKLKVLLPEELDYTHLFDEIFNKYTNQCALKKVKTTDFGSLIELTYFIKMNDKNNMKKFIDELRTKNGNLNIVLSDDYDKIVTEEN